MSDQSTTQSPPINAILFCLAFVFETSANVTAEEIYTWLLRSLTITSIVLIIIINIPKALNNVKKFLKWISVLK